MARKRQGGRQLEKLEAHLRERNEFIETILEKLPIGLAVHSSLDDQALYMNRAFERIYGWPEEDLRSVEQFFSNVYPDPHYRDKVTRQVLEGIRSGDKNRMIWRDISISTKQGEERFVTAQNIPLPEQDLMISTVLDTTDRKRAEQELKEQSERMQLILENIPIMIAFLSTDGSVLWANKTWEKTLGWTVEEAKTQDVTSKMYPDRAYRQHVREFIEKAQGKWGSFKTRVRSGVVLDTDWLDIKLPDDTRIGIGVDVTAQKKVEKEQARLKNRLVQAQKMEAVGRLAGGVAHDFNNMLSVILGNAEIAHASLDRDDDLYQDLEEIKKAAERSAALTKQLLAFSRSQVASPEILNLNQLVMEREQILNRLIGNEIALVTSLQEDLWNAELDSSQFDQILTNLTLNARNAIEGSGRIRIETRNEVVTRDHGEATVGASSGEYVILEYSDSGVGMEEEVLERIFEPFFTTKSASEGTGLGLSTVYGIVRQNEGLIEVQSAPQEGTTFKIAFPRVKAEAQIKEARTSEDQESGSQTILLVDDEPQVLRLTERILSTAGHTVYSCSSGPEAIRVAREHSKEIDMLLSDVEMPEMNGPELRERLKKIVPHLKTLFMSGYTTDMIPRDSISEVGVEFIQKPFRKDRLLGKVHDALKGPDSQDADSSKSNGK